MISGCRAIVFYTSRVTKTGESYNRLERTPNNKQAT